MAGDVECMRGEDGLGLGGRFRLVGVVVWCMQGPREGSTYGPATVGVDVSIVSSSGYELSLYLGRHLWFGWLEALTSWSGKGGSGSGVLLYGGRLLEDGGGLYSVTSLTGGLELDRIVSLG